MKNEDALVLAAAHLLASRGGSSGSDISAARTYLTTRFREAERSGEEASGGDDPGTLLRTLGERWKDVPPFHVPGGNWTVSGLLERISEELEREDVP